MRTFLSEGYHLFFIGMLLVFGIMAFAGVSGSYDVWTKRLRRRSKRRQISNSESDNEVMQLQFVKRVDRAEFIPPVKNQQLNESQQLIYESSSWEMHKMNRNVIF